MMKTTLHRYLTAGALATTFALSAMALQQADQTQPGAQRQPGTPRQQQQPGQQRLQLGSQAGMHQAGNLNHASKLKNKNVQSSTGEKLGTIEDFAIDTDSGRLAFVIVGSGGVLGVGQTLRAVPPQALSAQATAQADAAWTLNITQDKWEQAPKFEKDQLSSLAAKGQEIYQYYGQQWEQPGALQPTGRPDAQPDASRQQDGASIQRDSATKKNEVGANAGVNAGASAQLQPTGREQAQRHSGQLQNLKLASDLMGKQVHNAQKEQLGEISDVLVNLQTGKAHYVILNGSRETGMANQTFAISIQALRQGTEKDAWMAELTRQHFQQAQEFQPATADQMGQKTQVFRYQQPTGSEGGLRQQPRGTDAPGTDIKRGTGAGDADRNNRK